MPYNPYDAVKQILNAKKDWDAVQGDDEAANTRRQGIADYAKQYYNQLRQNGQGAIADKLEKSNSANAELVYNDYKAQGKKGKTATRQYLYDSGLKYNMDQNKINSLLGYDNDTGEVKFGGENLGLPKAEIEGVSYYDPETLDKAMSNYVSRAGITPSAETMYNLGQQTTGQNLEDNRNIVKNNSQNLNNYVKDTSGSTDKFIKNKYNDLYGYISEHNPFETEIGKAILNNYNLKGYDSAYNAKASSAAGNGGNIDSYAAANAARQQLAYKNAGTNAVIQDFANRSGYLSGVFDSASQNLINNNNSAYQTMLNNNLGVEQNLLSNTELEQNRNQQLFDNNETGLNNDVSRNQFISEISGYIPSSYQNRDNPWLNSDGSFNSAFKNTDFTVLLNKAKEKYKAAGNEKEKRDAIYEINQINAARNAKIHKHSDEFGQYADTMEGPIREETAGLRSAADDRDSAERISTNNNESNERMNSENNQAGLNLIDAQTKASIEQSKAESDLAFEDELRRRSLENTYPAVTEDSSSPKSTDYKYPGNSGVLQNTNLDTPQVSLVDYPDTNDGNQQLLERWVNKIEQTARAAGQAPVFTKVDDYKYLINTANTDYKNQIEKSLRNSHNKGEIRDKQLNYLLKAFGLI